MKETVYLIEKVEKDYDVYVLSSVVDTNFGGKAKNFVFTGTKEQCQEIKEKLEN